MVRRGPEINVGALAFLLVLLSGMGGWNYIQNTRIEAAELRPYRGYSDADLEELIVAYEGQAEGRNQRYEAASAGKVAIRGGGLFGAQVDEFERVQQISRERRELAGRVSDSEHALRLVREETKKREDDRPIYKLIFRRLITVRSF